MNSIVLLGVFLVINRFCETDASINWLSVGRLQNHIDFAKMDQSACSKLVGWTKLQRKFCKEHYEYTDIIKQAAALTLDECQSQFRNRRWNCSTSNSTFVFNKLPESGLREASYLYALSSAVLTYSITRACSEGRLAGCSCDESKQGKITNNYKWSGCSDNINYGMAVAENFLDPRLRNNLKLIILNLHNYETGRKIIERNMVKQCKCHGVSGSCEVKTCWRVMPTYKQIGEKLKAKYDTAVQVEIRKHNSNDKYKLMARNNAQRRISNTDIVYLNKGPTYCNENLRLAAYGTKDRVCNKNSRGIDSCNLLCCGRPYRTRIETITYKCNCTFKWCCSVDCKECRSTVEVTRCT